MAVTDTAAIDYQLKRVYPKRKKPTNLYKKEAQQLIRELRKDVKRER